jgi:hypothetical protein
MKPDPSSPSGENPTSSKPDAKEDTKSLLTGDGDLWDFDDDPEIPDEKPVQAPISEDSDETDDRDASNPVPITVTPRGPRRDSMPFKQAPSKKKSSDATPGEIGSSADPAASRRTRKGDPSGRKPQRDAFDDLEDQLDEDQPEPVSQPAPDPQPEPPVQTDATPSTPEVIPVIKKDPEPAPAIEAEERKPLSKVEKIALLSFLFLILAGGLFFIANSIGDLPEESKPLTEKDFPIKGAKLETHGIKSYWRDPVLSGPNADTVRRGTIIIPVVELKVSGGPAAVRIFFRDANGDTVGDAVSRPVKGESSLVLPSTAGFNEPGMYAAYRTGETKSWKVEVFEGPSAEAPGSEFKKLFEIPISTHRR